jgi:hypothetical protein
MNAHWTAEDIAQVISFYRQQELLNSPHYEYDFFPYIGRQRLEKLLRARFAPCEYLKLDDFVRSLPVVQIRCYGRHNIYHLRTVATVVPKRLRASLASCDGCGRRQKSIYLELCNQGLVCGPVCQNKIIEREFRLHYKQLIKQEKIQQRRVKQWKQIQHCKLQLAELRRLCDPKPINPEALRSRNAG